jgi:hypothetical protein
MKLTTGLLNYTGTPGAYTNTFANRPGATAVPTGTLYFSKDTNVLYQTNGSSWISYSGGGGVQNLSSVLGVGNNAANYIVLYSAGSGVNPQLEYNGNFINNGYIGLYWGDSELELAFKVINGGYLYGIAVDINTGVKTTYLGDVQQIGNGTEMWLNDYQRTIKTFNNRSTQPQGNGLKIDYVSNRYYFGEYFGYSNGTHIVIDDDNQYIEYRAGYANIMIANNFELQASSAGNGVINFNDSGFISGSAGSNTGQHLVIFVQGVQYKIQLKNP